ncbi:unknown [Clostridium sp. CAG:678]|nr:unknown [Clostridium sp. CAG:678]
MKIKIALVQSNKIQDSVNDTLLKGLEYCKRAKKWGQI